MSDEIKKLIQKKIDDCFIKKTWRDKIRDTIESLKEYKDTPEVAEIIKSLESRIGK